MCLFCNEVTVFCNLQISNLGSAFVFVCPLSLYALLLFIVVCTVHAHINSVRSQKVPGLPRVSTDIMHEESSCLFTLLKGMLKEPDS